MTYRGHVKNGHVVLDNGAILPEGATVCVEVQTPPAAEDRPKQATLLERYQPFIGVIDDLPVDMAEQHDHYIHGTPKK